MSKDEMKTVSFKMHKDFVEMAKPHAKKKDISVNAWMKSVVINHLNCHKPKSRKANKPLHDEIYGIDTED